MSLQEYAMTLLFLTLTLPLLSSGLECKCTGDCPNSTCVVAPGGMCYAQYYSDVSGKHWTYREGCLDDPSSVICQYKNSDSHTNRCCNETNFCNDNLITTHPPAISCKCNNNRKCVQDQCTLRSPKHSCYTIIRRPHGGADFSNERGCVKNCEEYHSEEPHGKHEVRTCCRGEMCNKVIPSVWPSRTITPAATTTTATPAPPTTDLVTPTPTTETPKIGRRLLCHCSSCTNGLKECEASIACASLLVERVLVTSCVNEEFSCKNDTFQLNCCYKDHCNSPEWTTPGPPCDDEDTEQSGGCEFSLVISSTAPTSTSTTTTTTTTTTSSSSTAIPISSSNATPTRHIITEDAETTDDNSDNTMMIFYFFTVLLLICIVTMIVVVVACVVMVCHYRSMAYKTVLSSSTILESTLKEKGYPLRNSSAV